MGSNTTQLNLPHRLSWESLARMMFAYAAECRTAAIRIAVREGRAGPAEGWNREAKNAERMARKYLAIQKGMGFRDEPQDWPIEPEEE